MGCCRSKDHSPREEYGSSSGFNSRHATTQRNTQLPSVGSFHGSFPTGAAFDDIDYPEVLLSRKRNSHVQNIEECNSNLKSESWYFGKIDIARCTKLLGEPGVKDGTFMVRESTSLNETLCISVKGRSTKGAAVFSVRVTSSKNRFGDEFFRSSINDKVFPSMHDVLRYYKENGLNSNGYSVTLGEGLTNQHYYLGGGEDKTFTMMSEDIDLGEIIGKGKFGKVYKGVWKKRNGERVGVAVKRLHCSDKEELKLFEKEINVMRMSYHDNVVTFFGIYFEKDDEQPAIVTELMPKGNLHKFLNEHPSTPLEDLYYFAYQVASGMKYLSSLNIIHRDLAARNVLLGDQHIVKIADFGLSRVLKGDETYASTTVLLPIKWTAPEGLKPSSNFTTKSDVWSYGIFLTELITRGKTPYRGIDADCITQDRLIHQGYRMQRYELGGDCSEELYAIMKSCWQSYPEDRPDFLSLVKRTHRLYEPYAPLRHC